MKLSKDLKNKIKLFINLSQISIQVRKDIDELFLKC